MELKALRLLRILLTSLAIVGGTVLVGAQSGPFSAQIQRALTSFLATAHSWTGQQTYTGPLLLPDGTTLLPALAWTSEPTLGLARISAGVVEFEAVNGLRLRGGAASSVLLSNPSNASLTVSGDVTSTGSVALGASGFLHFTGRGGVDAGANGNFRVQIESGTIGSLIKTDALPTVSACGAGSPAVVAGSTPLSGAVTIGTTAVATCTITFNGTAYPANAHCSGVVETSTAANGRIMSYLATTTTLTIVPTAAWADSSVVNWNCYSPKS